MNVATAWVARLRLDEALSTLELSFPHGEADADVARDGRCQVLLAGGLYEPPASEAPGTGADAILCAYARHGEAIVRRLRGAFAAVIFDASSETLLCVRDALGHHPVYYATCGNGIVLSNWMDALLREPGVSTEIDRVSVAMRLVMQPPPTEKTYFADVARLPGGHFLRVRRNEHRVLRYWDPEDRVERLRVRDPEEAFVRFRELMHAAVGRRLDFGRTAVFLSGGLDSSSVLAAAVEASDARGVPRPVALSVATSHPSDDEKPKQRAIAHALGVPWRVNDFADWARTKGPLLPRTLEISASTPGMRPSGFLPVLDSLANEAKALGCASILTGEGGDEWLLPGPYYPAECIRRLNLVGLMRVGRAWHDHYPVESLPWFLKGLLWKWGLRPLLRAGAGSMLSHWQPSRLHATRRAKALAALPHWLAPDPVLRNELVEAIMHQKVEVAPRLVHANWRRELLTDPNVSENLEDFYWARRRIGVSIESPFFDVDVVEFLYATPPAVLLHGGRSKWLARRLLASTLPSIVDRWPRTVYGDESWVEIMRHEGWGAWRAFGGVPLLSQLGIVDAPALETYLSRSATEGIQLALVWEALNLDIWLQSRILQRD